MHEGSVVQRLENAIRWINRFLGDTCHTKPFEQLGPACVAKLQPQSPLSLLSWPLEPLHKDMMT